jgi:MSHA biogenesis protein MshQ
VNLSFDNSGIATPTFVYQDVGRLSITVTDTAESMTGSTTTLPIIAPASFGFSGITAGPIGAGNAFSATVTALNSCATPAATPNFGKETGAESATISLGSRVAPAGANDCTNGPCTGSVAGNVTLPWNNGAATASNLSYSEVGQITLAAALASGSYLGSGLTATGTSGTAGDFVPAYFDTAVTQGCAAGSFTYSAQPFRVDVTAKNASAGTTVNYSNLASCTVCAKNVALYDPTAVTNFNSTNTIAATTFAKGVGNSSTVKYTFPTKPSAPASITLRAIDASVTPSVSSSGHTEGVAAIRSGLLQLSNVFGTGSLQLPVQIRYWSGQSWVLNSDDSCTVLPKGSTGLSGATGTLIASPPTVSCVSSPTNYCSGVDFKIVGGLSYIKLTSSALTASGSVNVCADLGADPVGGTVCNVSASGLSYLQGRWPPGAGYDNDPVARATFGVYATETKKSVHVREQF